LLDGVQQAAAAQAGSWRAFRMEVRGLGCFPNGQRPRVIWAAAQDPSGSLEVLATDLERLARETGFPAEERRFSAHLTIGRVKDRLSPEGQRRLAEWIQMSSDESYGTVQVGSIELFKSDLRPAGPIYSSLATFPLRG
jgi:2'-5' RNA ligase